MFFVFNSDLEAQGFLQQDWGRVTASFMWNQWICLNFLVKATAIPESAEFSKTPETLKAALSCSIEALSLLPSDLVLPALDFIRTVMPQASLASAAVQLEVDLFY